MPRVQAYIKPIHSEYDDHDDYYEFVSLLRFVCLEIVPAGLHSPEGNLSPGDIVFSSHLAMPGDFRTDVHIDIQANFFQDRKDNMAERVDGIMSAIKIFCPHKTFSIWPQLVDAEWLSDIPDPEYDNSIHMSMEAAIARVYTGLYHHATLPFERPS